jgi:phosphate:Na+ symporter
MNYVMLLFAGLGLFVIGMKELGRHFKNMSGPRLRRWVAAATNRWWISAVAGMSLGALTQSTNAAVFLTVSMVTSGLLPLSGALPVVVWSNAGTSVLVILATLDTQLLVGFLLAVVGACYYGGLHEDDRWRDVIGVALSAGLLFMGLLVIKHGAGELRNASWVHEAIGYAEGHLLLMLLAGAVLTVFVQSSATITVIAATLLGADLLSFEQTVMLVFGSSLGSGLSVCLIGGSLRGAGRTLVFIQAGVKALGVLVLLPLIAFERTTGLPGLLYLLAQISSAPSQQIAGLYAVLQVLPAGLATMFSSRMLRWAQRLTPADPVEELGRPLYLFPQAVDEPETALDLVDREQARVLARLPSLLDLLRPEEVSEPMWTPAVLRKSTDVLLDRLDSFLAELAPRCQSHHALERMVASRARQNLLRMLFAQSGDWVDLLAPGFSDPELQAWRNRLVEGMHSTMSVLADYVTDAPDLYEVMLTLTSDRSTLMRRMRGDMLQQYGQMDAETRDRLLGATSLFERIIWLMNRYVQT